jgi:hypothetical protein
MKIDQALKEKLLLLLVVAGVIFFLFYWTHMFFASKEKSYIASQRTYNEQISKVAELIGELSSGVSASKKLDTGLLSFVQTTAAKNGISNRILDLKPVSGGASGSEAVSLRVQALNLNEMNALIDMMESYSNVTIKSFSLRKRFDDPSLADINLELVKSK